MEYYTNNLTSLRQSVNDGLELNEESAKEILAQGKANMDAALEAEKQAHYDRLSGIQQIYADDEKARKKAIAQENEYYDNRISNIKKANSDLISAVTDGHAKQNLVEDEFYQKMKQYNADVEAENKRHADKIAEIRENANNQYEDQGAALLAEETQHTAAMEDLQNQFGLNLKSVSSETIHTQLGLLETLQSSHGQINGESAEFVRQFAQIYDMLPEDVRKHMDETVAAMNLTGRTGEIIDSVNMLCAEVMSSFDSGLKPKAHAIGQETAEEFSEGIDDEKESAAQKGKELADSAVKPMGAPTPLAEAEKSGEDTAEAYNSGINSKKPDAKKSGEDIADSAVKPMGAPTPMTEAKKSGQGLVTSMTGGMESNKPSAVTTAGGIMTDMHTAMGAVSFTGIGGNVVSGILSGLNDKAPSLMSRARSLATGIAGVIGGALRINSPSKVMIPMGEAVAEGMEVGLLNGAGSLYETASAISLETAETLGSISTRGMNLSGVHSTNYGDRLDRLLDAVEKLADSQTTMEIDGRPFGRLVREYV